MFSKRQATAYCCESVQLIEGYDLATSSEEQYSIHHRFEDMGLSSTDLIELGRYYKRPACELIFIESSSHSTHHNLTRWGDSRNVDKFSEWRKSAWQDPAFRQKQKEGLHKVQDTQEYRTNLSNGIKRSLASPEARKQRSIRQKKLWDNSPKLHSDSRERTRAMWQNPEYREKVMVRSMEGKNTPEFRQRMKEVNQAKAKNPEFLAKLKVARDALSNAYKEYKANGGELGWNKWRIFHKQNS